MVRLPPTPDPPVPGSLAAELAADTAHCASEKERDDQQLADLIRNNLDPSGRGHHLSSKKKRSPRSSKEKRSSQATNSESFISPRLYGCLTLSSSGRYLQTPQNRRQPGNLASPPWRCGCRSSDPQRGKHLSSFLCFPQLLLTSGYIGPLQQLCQAHCCVYSVPDGRAACNLCAGHKFKCKYPTPQDASPPASTNW